MQLGFTTDPGYSFLPLQAYEIMCMRGRGMQLGFTTDPKNLGRLRQKSTVSDIEFTQSQK